MKLSVMFVLVAPMGAVVAGQECCMLSVKLAGRATGEGLNMAAASSALAVLSIQGLVPEGVIRLKLPLGAIKLALCTQIDFAITPLHDAGFWGWSMALPPDSTCSL